MNTLTGITAWAGIEFKATSAFRPQLMVGLFGWVVPFAFMALWNTASQGTGIMTPSQTTAYYLIQLVTTNLAIGTWIVFGFGPAVYSGELSTLLMMPFSPVLALLAKPLVRTGIQVIPLILVVPLFSVAMNAEYVSDPLTIAASVGLYVLGWISATLAGCLWALTALWFGKWGGIMGLLNGLEWLLGGLIAPSAFMPDALAWAMHLSPFWLGAGGAGELLSGAISPAWWMLAVGLCWPVVLLIAFRHLWKVSMRRFEAVGI
jgi:ABC-type uncharacterized transport system permease subunit